MSYDFNRSHGLHGFQGSNVGGLRRFVASRSWPYRKLCSIRAAISWDVINLGVLLALFGMFGFFLWKRCLNNRFESSGKLCGSVVV